MSKQYRHRILNLESKRRRKDIPIIPLKYQCGHLTSHRSNKFAEGKWCTASMNGQKRQFPYHSVVPEVEVKRQNLSDTVPGFERTQPAVFEAPTGYGDQEVRF